MRRLRRRVLLALPIALAMALFGGAEISDPSSFVLRTRGNVTLPKTSLSEDAAFGLTGPALTDVLSSAVSASDPPVVAPHVEAVIKTAPTAFAGAAPRYKAPPAALADAAYGSQGVRQSGTWAVVIGVNDYPGSENDLRSAVNDADDMVQALRILGVASDLMLVLRDGQVTANTVLQSAAWLANHAAPDAVAGFFYAGHVRKTLRGNEEIVTSDGSSVTDGQLAAALDQVQATRSWVAMASCFGLGFDEVLKPGRVLTAAAGRNSQAYENSSIGRSYMVEYMVRQAIIQGRASSTVQTAFNYAVDRIRSEHPGREPVQIDNGNGALDLRPPNANRANEPRPTDQPTTQPPANEPPAAERPPTGGSQTCTKKGLLRICSN
jgi:hypothetical protein